MRLAAVIAATSLCLATSPLLGQNSARGTHAVTRVAAPLRESPDVSARALITIPPRTPVSVASCADVGVRWSISISPVTSLKFFCGFRASRQRKRLRRLGAVM